MVNGKSRTVNRESAIKTAFARKLSLNKAWFKELESTFNPDTLTRLDLDVSIATG
jgi:hypothetical protein